MASQRKYIPPFSTLLETRKMLAEYGLCYAERSDLTPQRWVEVVRPVVRGNYPPTTINCRCRVIPRNSTDNDI